MDRTGGKRLRAAVTAGAKKHRYVLCMAALGAFLLLLPTGGTERDTARASSDAQTFDRLAIQQEMETILSRLDGVGKLSLMLTVDGSAALELAQDESASAKRSGETDGEQTKKRETVVLGSGSTAEVVVTRSAYPEFLGALVVCEGGDSAAVRLRVTQAVSALTGLSSERITVVKGKP